MQTIGAEFELQAVGRQPLPAEEGILGFLFGDGQIVHGEAAVKIQFHARLRLRKDQLAAGRRHARMEVEPGKPVDIGRKGLQRHPLQLEVQPARGLARDDRAAGIETAALLERKTGFQRHGLVHIPAEVFQGDKTLGDIEPDRRTGRLIDDIDFDVIEAEARELNLYR